MKSRRLICPECSFPYPIWRLLIKLIKWRISCPYCKTRLTLSRVSAGRIGVIFASTVIILLWWIKIPLNWKNITLFFLLADLYVNILILLLGKLVKAPPLSKSFVLFPNLTQFYRKCLIIGIIGVVLANFLLLILLLPFLSGPIFVAIFIIFVIVVVVSLILSIIGWTNFLFGKKGIFRIKRKQDHLNK